MSQVFAATATALLGIDALAHQDAITGVDE
jgi:hypothetical protein